MKLNILQRIGNFLLQIIELPKSILCQALFGNTFTSIIYGFLSTVCFGIPDAFASGIVSVAFILPLDYVMFIIIGQIIVKKRTEKANLDYDDELISYTHREIVEKPVKDNTGKVIGTYETEADVTNYSLTDSQYRGLFFLEFSIVFRIISIILAFFAIFTTKYAVCEKPMKGMKSKKAWFYFNIIKF